MSEIQSILFKKRYWTKKRALDWLIKRNFKHFKIDETPKFFRFRQTDPKLYNFFRMIDLQPSIKAVIGFQ